MPSLKSLKYIFKKELDMPKPNNKKKEESFKKKTNFQEQRNSEILIIKIFF